MAVFTGIRKDLSDVGGDHFLDLRGASFHVEQQLQRRPGLTFFTELGGWGLQSFTDAEGNTFLIILEDDGGVEQVSL